jgi:HIRAN domain.
MARPIPKKPKEIEITVVGMQYRVTVSSRVMLADHLPFPVELEREPENREDENAIKVVAVKYFSHTFNDFHIGYVPRGVALAWASAMDTGKLTIAEAWVTGIDVDAGTATMLVKARAGSKFLSTKPK